MVNTDKFVVPWSMASAIQGWVTHITTIESLAAAEALKNEFFAFKLSVCLTITRTMIILTKNPGRKMFSELLPASLSMQFLVSPNKSRLSYTKRGSTFFWFPTEIYKNRSHHGPTNYRINGGEKRHETSKSWNKWLYSLIKRGTSLLI